MKKILIPITAGILGFFAKDAYTQPHGFNPAELPFNPKGFVLKESISNGLNVRAYNLRNNNLVGETKTANGDTLNVAGSIDTIPGFYDLIINTDLAATPNIEEGPKAGDELYFMIEEDGLVYRLNPVSGKSIIHNPGQIERWDMHTGNSAVSDEIPLEISLEPIYPNPFNPTTTLNYSLKEKTHISLDVYNINGQKIENLVDGDHESGSHTVTWDASGNSSGIYFFRLKARDYSLIRKGTFIK